ncbi:MAG: hypothetical protein CMJ31_12095 [Phycisphaerae bacterium]|nr:hypothetical protein [Phycisphaerae bacterium]
MRARSIFGGFVSSLWLALATLVVGAVSSDAAAQSDRYVIAMVPKSGSNPVFIAARSGAEAAARELGAKNGVSIELLWWAPARDDAARQIEIVRSLAAAGVDGIAISCSDPDTLTPEINRAATAGATVVTFDADAPNSARIAYVGIDDRAAGRLVIDELSKHFGENDREGPSTVAILTGTRTAANMVDRVRGVVDGISTMDNVSLVGAFSHDETPEGAAEALAAAEANYGPIDAWAFVGGWPMYTEGGLDAVPSQTPIVSIDLLPQTLDHLESGRVKALVGQPYFDWGYESVRMVFDRVHGNQAPISKTVMAPLEVVGPERAAEYRERWRDWMETGVSPTATAAPSASGDGG